MPRITKADLEKLRQAAFSNGVCEGERRTQDLRKQMQKTNLHLLKLLQMVDVKYPLAGVTITFPMAEQVIKGLRSRRSCRKLAGQLQRIVDYCNCEVAGKVADWDNEVKEVLDES